MRHGIRFVGTPTTYLYAPTPGSGRLEEGKLLTAIVGYAEDYVARLRAAAEGHDPVAEARAKAESNDRPTAWMELGELHVSRGEVEPARDCFQRIVANKAYALPGISPDSLNTLRRMARWALACEVTQRLEKDHARALVELERYVEDFPGQATSEDYVYAHAWSLASVGKVDVALAELERTFLQPATADGLLTFLYFAFRIPSPPLLERAEGEARAGLERFPEQEAAIQAAFGRILRRLGRLADAETAFARALELTPETDPSYPTYLAQMEFVRKQQEER
jgi:tetratricopeptide (TPR) repeat protein